MKILKTEMLKGVLYSGLGYLNVLQTEKKCIILETVHLNGPFMVFCVFLITENKAVI